MYQLGILFVVVTYVCVTSALPPCTNTKELTPVCGSDGQMYDSVCQFKYKQLLDPSLRLEDYVYCQIIREISNDDNACICTYEYSPVCGSNGRTYTNKCELDCEGNVQLAYMGPCRAKREIDYEPPMCFCTFENDPVCGSNGHTYSNMCGLECEEGKVQLAHRGECRAKRDTSKDSELAPCECSREIEPVCGTDGHTYTNLCLLYCFKNVEKDLDILHFGSCSKVVVRRDVDDYDCMCSRNMEPVCASDGITYNNECEMECAGTHLTVTKYERC